jgi:hypothetical protein
MSLWTLIRITAALVVLAVLCLTGMLAYHVAVEPLGGVFSRIIPDPVRVADRQSEADLAAMLDSAEMPDVDPGEKAFQKAHELLALGKLPEAREKLSAIVSVFPASSSAPAARRIVGEMNLDEILSTTHMAGKQVHVVRRGDSLLAIAAKYRTTIDCMMHLNSMLELKGLQPGDELIVMPLDFRLLVEPNRKALSLWEGGRFIREYPILGAPGSVQSAKNKTTIQSKSAESGDRRVQPQSKGYHAAAKLIQLAKPGVRIQSWDGTGERPAGAILLRPPDMEELSLLTRTGNDVEFR